MAQTYAETIDQNANTQAFDDLDNRTEALRSSFEGASAPSDPTPVEGQLWFDSTNDKLYIHDGSGFNIEVQEAGNAAPYVQSCFFSGLCSTAAPDANSAFSIPLAVTVGTWRIVRLSAFCQFLDTVGPSPGATTFRAGSAWSGSPTNYWEAQIAGGAKSATATTGNGSDIDILFSSSVVVWISTGGGHSDVHVDITFERVS